MHFFLYIKHCSNTVLCIEHYLCSRITPDHTNGTTVSKTSIKVPRPGLILEIQGMCAV